MTERQAWKTNGFVGLLLVLISLGIAFAFFWPGYQGQQPLYFIGTGLFGIIAIVTLTGIAVVEPNQAKVLTFLGTYVGTLKEQGFWFTIPFSVRNNVSLRVINFNSDRLKVNDYDGNPIEIAAVVVYRVTDASKAIFDVQNYERFVALQSETGLRHIASKYSYDNHDDESHLSLRKNSEEIAGILANDLQDRLTVAGVVVTEARIMHLAYSSEIAAAMLQRQQAQAVLSARKVIVDGAVGLVKAAIEQLDETNVVELDEEKKASMVNNLLVSLVSEKGNQPIINAGSIH
ncbi:hypothetical protein A374_17219 [Fictibacillus macauensis ZFHKF-1]|uniref:Band 7 domain-containing protein n=1 Tax=Fictibacillus macauensis ZFHKF-1 TaxID=1196324 RepID=I8AF95_9BACL|nr:SPFH domain-containing protein [Fictibacillus macauensis]EIT84019.1 hypothetical protein A374_17219 [Fictibacillus macauensis ZFHKF-1]